VTPLCFVVDDNIAETAPLQQFDPASPAQIRPRSFRALAAATPHFINLHLAPPANSTTRHHPVQVAGRTRAHSSILAKPQATTTASTKPVPGRAPRQAARNRRLPHARPAAPQIRAHPSTSLDSQLQSLKS
jgi:hypothetical protein